MLQKSLPILKWKSILRNWQQIDWILLVLVVAITTFGGFTIASCEIDESTNYAIGHWIVGILGLILAMTLAKWRYQSLLQWHWVVYAMTNLSLIAVILIGATAKGAQRWITIAGFNVQPSEFAKIGLIITLAAILHSAKVSSLPSVIKVLAITAVPWGLVFIQPDLGTSLVFGAITLGMLYWANVNPGWLILMVSPMVSAILFNLFFQYWLFWAALMTLIAWFTLPWRGIAAIMAFMSNFMAGKLGGFLWSLLKDYQKARLTLFLNPEKDPLGGGYHLIQSRIAIGSGELWGRGFGAGTQTQLDFVPEQHTDFIFSAVGEELGFIGTILVLLVFWLILMRLLYVACNAKENFGSLLAIGVLSMIAFQITVNVCMTVGLAPITGIPLPWMSYGRSALLTNFIAIGLVESVANYREKKEYWQKKK